MKILLTSIALLLMVSCTSRTDFGPCVGAFDDKDPTKIYKVNAWNVGMAILFFELVLPPVFVITDETFCPIGNK